MRKGPILVPALVHITHGFDCRARISSVSRNSRSFPERRLLFRVIPSSRSSVVLLFPPIFSRRNISGPLQTVGLRRRIPLHIFVLTFTTIRRYTERSYAARILLVSPSFLSRATFFLQLRVPTFAMSSGPGH